MQTGNDAKSKTVISECSKKDGGLWPRTRRYVSNFCFFFFVVIPGAFHLVEGENRIARSSVKGSSSRAL